MEVTNKYRNFSEDFSLKGKNVVITGTASGIGHETAKMFARKGANLIAVDVGESDHLEEYVKAQGSEYVYVQADITKQEAIDKIVKVGLEHFGKIDTLVNCAGVGILEQCEDSTQKVWDFTLAVNLTGSTNLALAVGKTMMKNGGGSIINLASQAGVVALEGHLSYGVSKAGIIHMTKQLAREWGPYEIRVNAISPTVILTPMGEENWNNEKGEAFKAQMPSRRFGYPEEVAACAVYLASDASALFNGANLIIDGGYTIV
jgi:Dehydrogenases with different specificities (related to short-chain alcohol dehydrogenases)